MNVEVASAKLSLQAVFDRNNTKIV